MNSTWTLRPVPILMYHEITPTAAPGFRKYSITPRAFAVQMDWLMRLAYVTVSLDAFLAGRSRAAALPARSVVITFDDGFRDCIRYAPPILSERGFTATFYPVAGLVGTSSGWLRSRLGTELPLAGWGDLRELLRNGFACGAHGLTHEALGTLERERCRRELVESKRLLESSLGVAIDHLAYPYGSYTPEVRQLAEEAGYQSACSVRSGLSAPHDDVLALRRVIVTGDDSPADFLCRLRTAESAGGLLRRGVRAIRGRLGRSRQP